VNYNDNNDDWYTGKLHGRFADRQRSICRGVGGFNPPLVEYDPHTGD